MLQSVGKVTWIVLRCLNPFYKHVRTQGFQGPPSLVLLPSKCQKVIKNYKNDLVFFFVCRCGLLPTKLLGTNLSL